MTFNGMQINGNASLGEIVSIGQIRHLLKCVLLTKTGHSTQASSTFVFSENCL